MVFLSARRAGDEKAKGERREAAQALSTTKGRAKPVRLSLLVGGEYHKQPIEPERIFREGEMGDFELRQNPPPLRFSRVTEAVRRSLLSLAAGVSIKAMGEKRRRLFEPEPDILYIFIEKEFSRMNSQNIRLLCQKLVSYSTESNTVSAININTHPAQTSSLLIVSFLIMGRIVFSIRST